MARAFGANGHTMDFGNMIDGPERGCGTAGSYDNASDGCEVTIGGADEDNVPDEAGGGNGGCFLSMAPHP